MKKITESEAFRGVREWKNTIDAFMTKNQDRDSILRYFDEGNFFEVSKEEIDEWGKRLEGIPEHEKAIHIYAAINNDILYFYLIDSKSDAIGDFDETIRVKELDGFETFDFQISIKRFVKSIGLTIWNFMLEIKETFHRLFHRLRFIFGHPIPGRTAKRRIENWEEFREGWLQQKEGGCFFQLIVISYSDYLALELKEGQKCKNFLALKNIAHTHIRNKHEHRKHVIFEIEIIAVNEHKSLVSAQDFSSPRPPFSYSEEIEKYQLLVQSDKPFV